MPVGPELPDGVVSEQPRPLVGLAKHPEHGKGRLLGDRHEHVGPGCVPTGPGFPFLPSRRAVRCGGRMLGVGFVVGSAGTIGIDWKRGRIGRS